MVNELTQFWEKSDQHRSTLIFNLYRVTLVTVFILSDLFHWQGTSINESLQPLFLGASLVYILFTIASVYWAYLKIQFNTVAIVHALTDILYFLILMHCFSGVSTLFPIFMNLAILGNGIVLPPQMVLPYVAVVMLIASLYHYIFQLQNIFSVLQLTVWFASFLMTGIVVRFVIGRLKYSQALASERGLHLFNLEKATEHIVDFLDQGVILLDADNQIQLINQMARFQLNLNDKAPLHRLSDLPEKLRFHLEKWLSARETLEDVGVMPVFNGLRIKFMSLGQQDNPAIAIFLEDTTKTVEEAQSMKLSSLGRFTASIAHELRNPLGAVSHAVQLLAEDPSITDNNQRLIDIILNQSERMNDIIKNVLQLSRRTPPQASKILVKDYLKDFRDKYKQIKTDKVEFSIELDNEGLTVYFDPSQLNQVLTNLCDNALKASAKVGRVARIKLKAYRPEFGQDVFLEVQDNGPGIEPSEFHQVFEPFYTSDRQGGIGLGLYLVKELCEANRAFIKAIHSPSGGACFVIQFRFQPSHSVEIPVDDIVEADHENSASG